MVGVNGEDFDFRRKRTPSTCRSRNVPSAYEEIQKAMPTTRKTRITSNAFTNNDQQSLLEIINLPTSYTSLIFVRHRDKSCAILCLFCVVFDFFRDNLIMLYLGVVEPLNVN